MRCVVPAVVLALLVPGALRADDHRARGDLAIRARDVFKRHCSECHTGSADPGRSRLNLLDHKQLVTKKTPIPLTAPNGASLVLDLVKDGSMPPANRPAPTPDEVAVLEAWMTAKVPAYPLAFDEDYVLNTIADELDRTRANPDRPTSQQYVSFAHLVQDGKPLPDLGLAETQLRLALGVTTPTGDAAPLVPVDDAGTVFRFDLAKQEWWGEYVFNLWEGRKAGRNEQPTRLEVLLFREYPYARVLTPADPVGERLKEYMSVRGLQTPFLRGDWLSSALTEGWAPRAVIGKSVRTPLAQDIIALTALRYPKPPATSPDGPVARPFASGKPVIVPASAEGRKLIPPLSSWYAGDVLPEKPPFTFKAELIAGGKEVAQVKVNEPFALHATCDKKAFFTLLAVQADGEIRVQPVQGGTVLQPGRERLLAPNGTNFSISGITAGGNTAVEHFVMFISEVELPAPTIVRSKHDDKYVWRFSMEPTEKFPFDPNAVVRKVIPVTVTSK